jgi:polyisoprenoid-binding protein YceI
MRSSRKVLLVLVVLVVAGVGAGLFWFFRDDAPEEVSLESATATLEETTNDTATGGSDRGTTDGTTVGDLTGSWAVDTETGLFDFESATGTFVGFRIQEELASVGSTTAVGRTGDVTGSMEIDGTTVTAASFEIDLTTLTTNESRRDDKVQEALETEVHPTATFTLTEPIELGAAAADGDPVTTTAVGELTVHGVTRPAEFAIEAQLTGGTAVVVGSTEVVFSDFGVEVPSAPVVLSVEDRGVVELQLLLVPR